VTPQHPPTQCPLLPFHLAHPKPSHSGLVSDFGPNPSLPRVSRAHGPTTTTTLYTPPHHPYALFPFAIPHGAPEIEPRQLGFGSLAQTPSLSPCICQRNAPPPPSPHTTSLCCSPSSFPTARPKLSPSGSVLGS